MFAGRAAWALVAVAAMVAADTGVTEGYYQFAATAARTGMVDGRGPRSNDTAFEVQLNGSRSGYSTPLIIGRDAYVLTSNMGQEGWRYDAKHNLAANALWKIPLDEPSKMRVLKYVDPGAPLRGFPNGLAAGLRPPASLFADPSHLYVVTSAGIWSVGHEGEDWRLRWPMKQVLPVVDGTSCADPAVEDGVAYMACLQFGRTPAPAAAPGDASATSDIALFGVAVDLAQGKELWSHLRQAKDIAPGQPAGAATCQPTLAGCTTSSLHIPSNVVKVGSVASFISIIAWNIPPGENDRKPPAPTRFVPDQNLVVWTMLDAKTGQFLWEDRRLNPEIHRNAGSVAEHGVSCKVTGDGDGLYLRSDRLYKYGLRNHNLLADWNAFRGSFLDVENCAGFAYDGRYVWSSWLNVLERFDTTTRNEPDRIPMKATDPQSQTWSVSPFLIADGVLYGRSTKRAPIPNIATENWIRAVDTTTLEELWSFHLAQAFETPFPRSFEFGVASGVVVVAGYDGRVVVIGETAASLRVAAAHSGAYPRLGEPFAADLSATRAGAFGPASEYAAEWGDGTETPWQAAPKLTHTFGTAAPPEGYQVRLRARNLDGQESSLMLTVFAGRDPPPVPGLFERALAPEGLPYSLGLLILLVASAGGASLVGVRRRLRDQGAKLERVTGLLSAADAKRYLVVRELGHGTFGTASLARDTRLDRLVVLKQPRASWTLGPEGRAAFLREAQLAAKIHHPNVVAVLEVLPDSNPPVLVMEHIEKGSVEARLTAGPLPFAEACRIGAGVLEGLDAVHRAGLVHRDLKPANVLLGADDTPKVADFGIAGPPTPSTEVAPTWGAVTPGTLAYMSPEQVRGEAVGVESDLHAAGVLLHEMLTGRKPYRATNPEALWREIASGRTHIDRALPKPARGLLERLLSAEPGRRGTATEAAAKLRTLAVANPSSAGSH